MKFSSFFVTFVLVFSMACSQSDKDSTQQNPDLVIPFQAKNVLFIGNSHTNYNLGLDHYLRGFTTQAGLNYTPSIDKITIDGATMQDHAENANTINKLSERDWDIIILQENTTRAANETTEAISGLQELKFAIPGNSTEIYLFMTWAYEDQPEMLANIRATYEQAAPLVPGTVVPIGVGFKQIKDDPLAEFTLYNVDGIHPSPEGSFFAAAMFYAAIYDKDPSINPYTAGLEPATALYLKEKAKEVWEAYQD
ncbi:MAG: hypothetical protein KJO16_03605 [Muriicola sp.]|nr:hypothetical protein [Muriicola sp.]